MRVATVPGILEVEIDKYSGNPLDYQYFASMLHQVMEKKVSDQPGRLTRLLRVTGGEAKESINPPPTWDWL